LGFFCPTENLLNKCPLLTKLFICFNKALKNKKRVQIDLKIRKS
jgi:hypothetical protein